MNYIDNYFYNLIEEFKTKDIDFLYKNMVYKFSQIPIVTQQSFEKFFKQFNYWGELDLKTYNFDIFYQKAKVFKEHYNDFVWLYTHLQDFQSKFLLFAILNNYYNFDFVNLDKATEKVFKHYFDLNIMPQCENEVLVDVGSYTGDSCIDFINSYKKDSYKKIYCYEITQEVLQTSKNNLKNYDNIIYKNNAVTNQSGKCFLEQNQHFSGNKTSNSGSVELQSVTLDDDIKEEITMIKMDIEGGEKNAIEGCKNHIKNQSPKLLISVYHNNTDIFEIPKQIYEINDNYNFYLRYYGGKLYATEIVLICTKK